MVAVLRVQIDPYVHTMVSKKMKVEDGIVEAFGFKHTSHLNHFQLHKIDSNGGITD